MSAPIPNHPSHIIELPAATEWLAAYGLDIHEVSEAVIRLGYDPGTKHIGAWLDVTWYKLNEGGRYFEAGNPDEAATGKSTIPLTSFPPLTQLPISPGAECGATTVLFFGLPVTCIEPAGHAMPHRSAEDATWAPTQGSPP